MASEAAVKPGLLRSITGTAKLGWETLGSFYAALLQDKICLILMAIFAVVYAPQAFILINDFGLIIGAEGDPGSHVAAIESLLKTYNMHAAYHSKFYGWTYFALNFFLLTPLNLTLHAFHVGTKMPLYLSIRLILFAIGLLSTMTFYGLLKAVFSSRFLATTGGLLYAFSPVCFTYFYIIHPETTGITCILIACYLLIAYMNQQAGHGLYFTALVFLVLAALSKQIFFFVSLPVILCFAHLYCRKQQLSWPRFLISKPCWGSLAVSAVIAFVILFAIHPYSIIEFEAFLRYQQILTVFVNGPNALSLHNTLVAWKHQLLVTILIDTIAPMLLIAAPYSLWRYNTRKDELSFLLFMTCVFVVAITALIVINNRLFIGANYLQPLYPFVIVIFLAVARWAIDLRNRYARVSMIVLMTYLGVMNLALDLQSTFPAMVERLDYKQSVAYKTFFYISSHVTKDDKIAYDHFVAVPDAYLGNSCHYWHGCGTDEIETFAPNYVIFNTAFTINDKPYAETERLKKYVADHHMALVEQLSNAADSPSGPITVSVYKTP